MALVWESEQPKEQQVSAIDEPKNNRVWESEMLPETPETKNLLDKLGGRIENIKEIIKRPVDLSVRGMQREIQSTMGPVPRRPLHITGQVAGGVTDIVGEAIIPAMKAAPPPGVAPIKAVAEVFEAFGVDVGEVASQGMSKLAETDAGKMGLNALSKTLQGVSGAYASFKEQFPDVAQDIESELNIALALPVASVGRLGVKKSVDAFRRLKIPLTDKAARIKAAKIYEQTSAGTEFTHEQVQQNIKIAKELEAKIPGLKFSRGQLTNDASTIQLERSLARQGGADMSQEQRAMARQALDKYYAEKVASSGKVEDLTAHIQASKRELEAGSKKAEQAVESEVMRLSKTVDEQGTGRAIHRQLKAGKQTSRDIATAKYNKIPNDPIETDVLMKDLKAIKKGFDPLVEDPANFPTRMWKGFMRKISKTEMEKGKEIIVPKEIGFQDLRKMRTQVLNELRNPQLTPTQRTNYAKINDAIEDSIDTLKGQGNRSAELYRDASSYYAEYSRKYGQGTVAEILKKGRAGEETKVAMANIAQKFNSLDGIDDFMRAVGNDKIAASSMKNFYSFDLLNAATDASTGKLVTKKAMHWLARNSGKLKKLGIYDDFKNVIDMQKNVDVTQGYLNVFNKSVANRVLEADVDNVIANAFRGSKNYATTADELLMSVKGNKAAEAGLKRAMTEHIMRESEATGLEFFQAAGAETVGEAEFIKSVAKLTRQAQKYQPAFKVIFRNEPEKLRALNDVWKSYQTLERTAKSPIGSGSDTAEHLFAPLIDIGAGGVAPGKWYPYKVIRNLIRGYSNKQVNGYLRRALYDPDYAANLLAVTKKNPSQAVQAKFTDLLIIASGAKKDDIAPESNKELQEIFNPPRIRQLNKEN